MQVSIKRQNQGLHFTGINSLGNTVEIDGSKKFGGEDKGARPMELILMGLAGCASIDMKIFLEKMKQNLTHLEVKVEATRVDAVPAVFDTINLHFILGGDLKEKKVEKAISLSMDKYCSVGMMLKKAATITSSYEILDLSV